MFEARLVQGALLKKLADAILALVENVNMDCAEDGITIQAMDNAHVCLLAMHLRADGFESYRCDRPLTLGVPLKNLTKLLKSMGKNDIVTLKADDKGDTLVMMFEDTKGVRVSDFSLKMMELDVESLQIPETAYSACAWLPAAMFAKLVKDLAAVGTENVQLSIDKDMLKLSTAGDIGTAHITLRSSGDRNDDTTRIELNEAVKAEFSLKYLVLFASAAPLTERVKLQLSNDLPLVVEFGIPDIGRLCFYLAPKITDDEEEMAAH